MTEQVNLNPKTKTVNLSDGDRHLFEMYHRELKDAKLNISEQVVKDVSEVIKPVIDKMNEGFRRSDNRFNRMALVGGMLFLCLVIGIFIVDIRARSNKNDRWDSRIESTLRPANSNAQNLNVVSGR